MNYNKLIAIFTAILMVGMTLGIAAAASRIEVYDYTGNNTGYAREKVNYSLFNAQNYTGERIDITGNITLGQKITFAFGEIIDNLVNKWITITGNLSVTGDIDTNNGLITEVNSIDFNLTANATCQEGRITWNDDDKTINVCTNIAGVSNQVGQENYIFARNNLGFAITNGQLVYINGAQGSRPTVQLAKADIEETSEGTIGMATHNCLDGNTCFFTTEGLVRDLDTSAFTTNDTIFLSPSIAGGFTNIKPDAPNHSVRLGHVLRSNANEGVIHLRIQNGFELRELHDVHYVAEPSEGNILFWNDSTSRWENGNTINNNLTVGDTLYLDNTQNHFIRIGYPFIDGIADDSFVNVHEEDNPEGEVLECTIYSPNGNLTNMRITDCNQVGRNNSVSYRGNSQFIGPNNICTLDGRFNNGTVCDANNVTNVFELYDHFNITPFFSADTSSYGATLFVQGGLDVWRQLRVLDGLIGDGTFDWNLNGNVATYFNGSILNSIPTTFASGFLPGDQFTILNVIFLGSISPFVNEDISPEVWFISSGALCDSGGCAEATGSPGSVDITMSTNFSTENVNETELNFVYSLVNLIGSDEFRVDINNFNGSGWLNKLTDSGTETTLNERILLDEGYSNLSSVGLRFVCDVTSTLRSCFVDSLVVNGTFTANTTATVNGFNSEICFSDGSRDVNDECNRGIFYDASVDQTFIKGVLNTTLGVVSGISGSGTTNNWAKFTAPTSIGNAPISDDGSLITMTLDLLVNGFIKALDWSNVTITESQISDLHVWNSTNTTYDENNNSMKNYVDSQDSIFNDSNNNYILDNNNSVNNYILYVNSTNPTTHTDGLFNSTSWNRTGTNVHLANSGDNVGIGATTIDAQLHLERSDTSTDPQLQIEQGSTGDSLMEFLLTGTRAYQIGIDNADSDKFKISEGTDGLGTDNFLTIQSTGEVGIGTASPGNILHVKGSVVGLETMLDLENQAGRSLTITSDNAVNGLWNFSTNDAFLFKVDAVDAFTINTAGNVGIGISSPDTELHVNGTALLSKFESIGTSAYNEFHTSAGQSSRIGSIDGSNILNLEAIGGSSSIRFDTNSAEAMRIDSSGNVGIGTSGPTDTLNVVGTFNVSNSTGSLGLYQDADGNVGIGTATPSKKLHIVGESGNTPLLLEANSGGNSGAGIQFWKDSSPTKAAHIGMEKPGTAITDDLIFSTFVSGGPGWSERMRIRNSDGWVGIGKTAPGEELDVNGTIRGTGKTAFAAGLVARSDDSASNWARIDLVNTNVGDPVILYQDSLGDFNLRNNEAGADFIFRSVGDVLVKIEGGGNVGIGTGSPSEKLEVNGNQLIEGNLTLKESGETETWIMEVAKSAGHFYFWGDDETYAYRILDGDNTFDFNNNIVVGLNILQTYNNQDLEILSEEDVDIRLDSDDTKSTGHFNISGSDGNLFWVGEDGNVGINTTNPIYVLQVESTDDTTLGLYDPVNTVSEMWRMTFDAKNSNNAQTIYSAIGSEILTNTAESEDSLMRFVTKFSGIETDSLKLSKNGFIFNEDSWDIDFRIEGDNDANLIYGDAGNDKVGIGTSTPADKLTVVGDINVSGCIEEDDGTLIGGTCISGRDYKMNEQKVIIDWDKFNSVSPKTWDWKQSSMIVENKTINLNTNGRGFIYEDILVNYPERTKIEDGVKKVVYGFDWVLDNRNAIQELKQENTELKQENTEIKTRLDLIEQMLNVSYVEPKEDSLPLYYCAIESSTKECPLGISGGKQTRCYLSEILTVKTWDYCSSSWNLI